MARSQGELTVRRCRPSTAALTGAAALTETLNQSTTPIAIGLSTADSGVGTEPSVERATGNVYGLFESYQDNGAGTSAVSEQRVGVITGGIVRFVAGTAAVAADLGKGVIADTNAGEVKPTAAATDLGKGAIVGFETVGAVNYVWVDLDATPLTPGA